MNPSASKNEFCKATFNCCFWTGLSHCVGMSFCLPQLLVYCVAASLLPVARRPHEQKLEQPGSRLDIPGACMLVLHGLWMEIVGSIKMKSATASKFCVCGRVFFTLWRKFPSNMLHYGDLWVLVGTDN